jgi:hypothetical protein
MWSTVSALGEAMASKLLKIFMRRLLASTCLMAALTASLSAPSFAAAPSTSEVADLRLVPVELIGIELGASVVNSALDTVVGRTQGFALREQPAGALRLEARGEPFEPLLGGQSSVFVFDPAIQGWQARTDAGTVQIRLNTAFADPQSNRSIPWSGLTVCRAATQQCSVFFLAKADQVCRLMNSGNFKAEPTRRQQALQALNAINAKGIECAAS